MMHFITWLEMLKVNSPVQPNERRPDIAGWRDPAGLAKYKAKLPPWKKDKMSNFEDRNKGYNQ